jgi:non-heme chloroperoxidase
MPFVTTNDGVEIFYKDWGPKEAQPVVFHHGWPLSSDDWDAQMLFFLSKGYRAVAGGPFYGYNRPGVKASEAVVDNWWRQGMAGGAKAHYDGIKAFSETDFTEDLKAIDVPTLVLHGDDDQVVPIADSALLSVKLLRHGTLKVYEGYPHGLCTTHADAINADLLEFLRAGAA